MLRFSDGYRYDLHLHSLASPDCRTSIHALLAMTRRRRLTGIALTDHDTLEGAHRLAEIWPHGTLQLIPGCERTLADGSHLIGLFLTRALTALSPREVIQEIREQGGLVYIPHPYRRYSGIAGESSGWSADEIEWTLANADLFEGFNTKCTPEENQRALERAHGLQKSVTAASDGHQPYEIGMACTVFAEPLSVNSFASRMLFAPPAHKSAALAQLRRGDAPPLRTSARHVLDTVGLLTPVKILRDSWRCYIQPTLQKYP